MAALIPSVVRSLPGPRRVLIAADVGAGGIWLLGPRQPVDTGPAVPESWSALLGSELIAALEAWNDKAHELFSGRIGPGDRDRRAEDAFYDTAAGLAARVQRTLGEGWEVLWSDARPGWCYTWAETPSAWRA